MPHTVAIVGRPNVGKSTLFNRLVGRRLAIVHPTPGVTRDRREGRSDFGGLDLRLIDTAGLDEAAPDTLEDRMRAQTERALAEADAALLLIDARAGVTPLDAHFAAWLRRIAKVPVVLVANKAEGRPGEAGFLEAFSLGFGEPVAISAEHGEGMGALFTALVGALGVGPAGEEPGAPPSEAEAEEAPLRLAIVGRPNVGKSTLVNRLLGEERVLTGPEPGVTRESIAVEWTWQGRRIRLFDTAGMRRRARVSGALERLSVEDALAAVRFAEVVVLLLDATEGIEHQDLAIASQVAEEGRALVIVLNKWDLVGDGAAALRRVRERIEDSLPQVKGAALLTLSALTGRGVEALLPAVAAAHRTWNRRIATAPLNRWLAEMIDRHPPPMVRGRRLRLRYLTQIKTRPPTFALFTTRPEAIPGSYLRYLANGLRRDFDLPGVPLRLLPRKGRNPYAPEAAARRGRA